MKKEVEKYQFQVIFFDLIGKSVSKNEVFADKIAEFLGISRDAAYRRIRGEMLIDFKELTTLCKHYGVSYDTVIGMSETNQIRCLYTPLDVKDNLSLMAYTNNIVNSLGRIKHSPENEILLSASCMPFFCLGGFRDLVLFNFYSWNKNVYGISESYNAFLSNSDVEKMLSCYKIITDIYLKTPSTEIWSAYTIDSFLNLLKFHFKTGSFEDNNVPIRLCKDLLNLLEQIQYWAENGAKKPKDTPFRFYIREVGIENTYILCKNPYEAICLSKLFTVNSLIISDNRFCIEMESWLRNLLQQATMISAGAAIERFEFFSQQRNKITDFMIACFNENLMENIPDIGSTSALGSM